MAHAPRSSLTRRPNLVETVQTAIVDAIRRGEFKVGNCLPTEQELSTRYGVSRPTMREAIIRLRAGSPFLSRQGYRTFIDCHPDAYHPLLPFADISCVEDLRQCYEFRRTIEGGAAKYAALNRDGDDIENIWQAFYRLHVSNTLEENSVDADLAFHITIAEASRNPLVLAVLKSLRNQISFAMDLSRKFSPSHQPQRKEAVKQEHRRVVEAIVRKDSIAAEAAMQFHIGMATVRLVGT